MGEGAWTPENRSIASTRRVNDGEFMVNLAKVARKAFSDHVYGFDHVIYFRRDIRNPMRLKKFSLKEGVVRIGTTREEIAPLLAAFPDRAKFFLSYIDEGLIVAFAEVGDTVTAYTWAATRDFYDRYLLKNMVRVGDKEYFHFAGYVVPSSRGTPVALVVTQHMIDYFESNGFVYAKTSISYRNEPSLRFCQKIGYVQMDEALDVYKVFNYRWSRETTPRMKLW